MQIRRRIKTAKPETVFEVALEQELLSFSLELSALLNNGLKIMDNFAAAQQNHIADADGTLASATTTINAILTALENIGILKSS